MAGYPVHRSANPWRGHRLLRRANIQPSATTGHSVHNAEYLLLGWTLCDYACSLITSTSGRLQDAGGTAYWTSPSCHVIFRVPGLGLGLEHHVAERA